MGQREERPWRGKKGGGGNRLELFRAKECPRYFVAVCCLRWMKFMRYFLFRYSIRGGRGNIIGINRECVGESWVCHLITGLSPV